MNASGKVKESGPTAADVLMQEYNICFTTVSRPADGSIPPLPENGGGSNSAGLAPLPVVIQGLVRKRREVKAQMKVRGTGQSPKQGTKRGKQERGKRMRGRERKQGKVWIDLVGCRKKRAGCRGKPTRKNTGEERREWEKQGITFS